MTELTADNMSVIVDDVPLLEQASFTLRAGELVALLGPNGAGKTTLLRGVLGLKQLAAGSATLDGFDISKLSPMERARRMSYLPQRRPLAWPNTVRDVVSLGRFSHGAALGRLGTVDSQAVDDAIQSCDLTPFADRSTDSLSGGELARVHFARAIAAQAPLLIADEPVAELDPRHQLRIAELIRHYVDDGGGALVVLHEVALAARFADRLIWMSKGRIVADGTPTETLTEQRMREVYGVQAHVNFDVDGFDVRIEAAL
jgi:iron complex transport system ATP-binding protein